MAMTVEQLAEQVERIANIVDEMGKTENRYEKQDAQILRSAARGLRTLNDRLQDQTRG